jgi:hypothetical protein
MVGQQITGEIAQWIVDRVECIEPDDRFDTNDRFRFRPGRSEPADLTDGDHRCFDLLRGGMDSLPPNHGRVNVGRSSYAWPCELVVSYVVPAGGLERVRRMVDADASKLIAYLEAEDAWPVIQGTAAGSLVLLRVRLMAVTGQHVPQSVLQARYSLDVEFRRNWS